MSNPFALLPFAIAAADAQVANQPAQALIAAGVTLLQRCAPLVKRMAVERTALLLPRGPALVTALAACDGHIAFLVDATVPIAQQKAELTLAPIGVLFTLRAHASACPDGAMIVLLDDVPSRAEVQFAGASRMVDLGSHVGLALEGDRSVEGSDDPVIQFTQDGHLVQVSHAELMHGEGPAWLAPWLQLLLAGGHVH